MQLLKNLDADEVSPVRRGANRKRVVLKSDEGVPVEAEIAEIMAVPWEREGALADELRKEGVDEVVLKATVGAMRLLSGVSDELPTGMQEAVAKLGREMYPTVQPPLNETGVPSPGGLEGGSHGDPKDGSAGKQTDLDGSGRDGELEGSGAGKKVSADAEPDADDEDDPAKKKAKGSRMKGVFKSVLGLDADTADEASGAETPATDSDEVEKGGTVDTHAVPIQKEDGSWDLSAVPEGSRPFYQAMIEKADRADALEEKVEKQGETIREQAEALRTSEIIQKAETQFKKVGARDDVVEVLKSASANLSPEANEALIRLLSGANEQIEKGDLFGELGRTGYGSDGRETEGYAAIEKAAAEMVEKAGEPMSTDQAVSLYLSTPAGSQAYSQYLADTGLGVS